MTFRISLVAAALGVISLASCGEGMRMVSSSASGTASALAVPEDNSPQSIPPSLSTGSHVDPVLASATAVPGDSAIAGSGSGGSQSDSLTTGASVALAPSAPAGGIATNVVDGICEGAACSDNEFSSLELTDPAGLDRSVSIRNDQ